MEKKLGLWVPVLVLAAALMMLTLSTGEVEAGGKGKGGGRPQPPPPPSTAVCSASPNPVRLWTVVTISGSGFAPYSSVGYVLTDAGGTHAGWVTSNSAGSFSKSYQTYRAGTTLAEFSGGGAYATCSFQVD